ncbi:hypothetical protein AtNW77_Chr3g0166511 [Arabidopsis thaliana]|uniref:Uncharacterized protein n=1 Tax=Arabidopsis thaliana x Arabidopsis arenosa TaxID=1240361 RepID=A0A8T2ET25_9BRAS|nr:hypothetical protein ISN45_At03g010710 [Arabidopsis thaliana x Arabidopsis arenosa]
MLFRKGVVRGLDPARKLTTSRLSTILSRVFCPNSYFFLFLFFRDSLIFRFQIEIIVNVTCITEIYSRSLGKMRILFGNVSRNDQDLDYHLVWFHQYFFDKR